MRDDRPQATLLTALLAVALLASWGAARESTPASDPPPPPNGSPATTPAGAAAVRSQWWDEVEAADALIRKGAWRKAARLVDQTLGETLRAAWQEPDLNEVLAAQSLQRSVLALHQGETETALWFWDGARNLDPAVDARLDAYGDLAPDLVKQLLDHPLRRLGRLPDGTKPPPRFATPGYRPMDVEKIPPVGLFGNAWARQLGRLPPVTVEVVVGADGAFHDPVVTREGFPPVLLYWTLEQIRTADVKVRPAQLDGKSIDDLTTIEMDFKTSARW